VSADEEFEGSRSFFTHQNAHQLNEIPPQTYHMLHQNMVVHGGLVLCRSKTLRKMTFWLPFCILMALLSFSLANF